MGAALWALCALWAGCACASLLPQEEERLRASVGGYAVMNCHLDFPFGIEIPYHLQWDKDGEEIFSWYSGDGEPRVAERWRGRVQRVGGVGAAGAELGGGAVNVSAVRESDAGLYRCRVAFPNRSPPARNNGTFLRLDVDGDTLIATPPRNATVREGERAELECAPRAPGLRVRWFRGAEPVAAPPAANGSLLLPRAAAADPGRYECRVSAPDGRTQSAAAYLDVQYPAKVVHSPEERFLPAGKAASLDCHFSANPPLTNLRWEKDGFLFDPYNVPGVFYSRNGSLLFNRVDESHAGEYSCTPYNALGSAGASRGVRVRVLLPPALAAAPPPLTLARLGAAVTLACAAAPQPDAPPPEVRWARVDGRALPERASVRGGNLTIAGVAPADRGVYECRVSNAAAELRAQTELLVENAPPRAPHALSARAAGAHAAHVSWAAGARADEQAVWYRERGAGEWRSMRVAAGAARATLLGLRAGTEYELRVLAQDHVGDGLFSRPVFVRTAPDPEEEEASTTEDIADVNETPATDAARTTPGAMPGATPGADDYDDDAGAGAGADDAVDAYEDGARWSAADERPAELQVRVRLVDEGALVVWRGAGAAGPCELRWYEDAPPERRLLAARPATHDYALVSEVAEGARYWAAVACGGARGGAALEVPRWSRLRGAALGSAAAALLLAALGAALYVARRRLARRRAR